MKLIQLNGKAGMDDGYYDGSTVLRARKPVYVKTLLEERNGLDLEAVRVNTRENTNEK